MTRLTKQAEVPEMRSGSTSELVRNFEHIFANSRDMMNLFSLSTRRIVMMNPAAQENTGYTLEELRDHAVEKLYPPEEQIKLAMVFDQLRTRGYSSGKLKVYFKGGELRDIWVRAYVVQHEPEVLCLVHTMDITEDRRRQERELRSARLATLGQASATMAHELKNALQSMQYSLASLRKRLGQKDPAASEKVVRRLERAVSHMDDVISNIHSATDASASRESQYVSLPHSVDAVLELLHGYLNVKSIEVETSFAPQLPVVRGDRVQVEQILIILIKNAVQAMATRDERRLSIHVTLDDTAVRMQVADTGGGLPDEVRERIFESFVTTKPSGIGIGLGLPTAKRLASACDINLTFESEENVGTRFTLEFALSGAPASNAPHAAALSARNVLVVGDDASTLATVSAALTSADARVLVAVTAAEAVQALRLHVVEVLVCDDAMYPVTASTFLEQVREVFHGPVCLLANQRPHDAMRYGHVDCIVAKPVLDADLVNTVAALIG